MIHVNFNMFTGLAHTYDPTFEVDTSKFNLVTQHLLEVWCDGNVKHYNWGISWFVNIVQCPAEKVGKAIALHSTLQGAGKGIIANWFGMEIIGKKYYAHVDYIKRLIGQFTKHMEAMLFTLCNEV